MTDLAGFDSCFAIGAGGVGQALQSQVQPIARTALRGIGLALPNSPSATLDVNVDVQPGATIAGGQATITATGTGDLRMSVNGQSLVTLPVTGGTLPGALAAVPISVSPIPFSMTFVLTITRPAAIPQVTIGRSSVQVTTPGFPQATLANELRDQLNAQLTTILGGGPGTIDAAQVTSTANALAAAIPGAVVQVVRQRLEGLFPLPFNFTMAPVNANVFCNIGLRDVQVALLDGQAGASAPCLAIVGTLLPSSTGTLGNLRSPLPLNEAAGVFFDNHFLISAVCCGLRNAPQFQGLPPPTAEPQRGAANACCTWDGINVTSVMDGRTFRIRRASLCLDQRDANNKKFVMSMRLTTSDTGWTATVDVEADITLAIQNGVVVPQVGQPRVNVTVDFEWWVVLIAVLLVAIVALLVAVLVGVIVGAIAVVAGAAASAALFGLIGAGIAAAIVIVLGIIIGCAVNDALKNSISDALRAATGTLAGALQTLRIVPAELQEVFGELEAARLVFDDLQVFGRPVVKPPVDERPIIVVDDLVVPAGVGIDLDRGATLPATDPDCDLLWRAPMLSNPLLAAGLFGSGAAALVRVTGVPYEALNLAALRRLAFPATGGTIAANVIPTQGAFGRLPGIGPLDRIDVAISGRGGIRPVGRTVGPVVFGVRTGERRYARCAAWNDELGKLHLRYTVFEVEAPLALRQTWTSRNVPRPLALEGRTRPLIGRPLEVDVVRTCRLQAVPLRLQGPVTYAWTWNGAPVQGTQGPLPGGVAAISVAGATCTITGEEGENIAGEICVRATDAFGVPAQVCRDLAGSGTDTIREPRFPIVEPVLLAPRVPRIGGPEAAEEPAEVELPDLSAQLLEQLEELASSG